MSQQYDWENGEANWEDMMGPEEEEMPDASEVWGAEEWEPGMAG